ncbi:MAG TPA: Gfo/Idh/MocA family oxidoreductase [Kiritimatiellia bacterium]|nr:Gfo/Idh/MocA family oxidoreductase [Kiritimatiellia bacterium]HMO98138.1 Gfo/Idh/MocA family oxidoreductase [Kiritimatiellia bacterium]HMP96194.1 Gfo/Idh/MocA family oxidoreductase [Kiritimatiellia bacterium]
MKTRLAVIGLGRWGPNHVRNFNSLPGAEVVVGVDLDEACRKRIAGTYGIEAVSDYREVLARPDVDAVVVCTPTATHIDVVEAALLAGKHVLCEKPLTHQAADAWKLVRLAEEKKRLLMTGHIFLFNPGIEYLADAVKKATAGPVYYIKAVRANLGPFRRDVNAAWDLASHDLYIFNHILGQRPEWVAATGASYLRAPVEDIVFLTLQYPNGVLGHIHVSWLDPKKIREITIVGEKKMITWDEFGNPGPVLIHDRAVVRDPVYDTFGEFQLLTKEGDILVPRIPSQEPLNRQARYFVEACQNPDRPLDKGYPKQAAEVVDILEAASRSLAEDGRKIPIVYGG